MGILLYICCIFSKYLFLGTPLGGCFCSGYRICLIFCHQNLYRGIYKEFHIIWMQLFCSAALTYPCFSRCLFKCKYGVCAIVIAYRHFCICIYVLCEELWPTHCLLIVVDYGCVFNMSDRYWIDSKHVLDKPSVFNKNMLVAWIKSTLLIFLYVESYGWLMWFKPVNSWFCAFTCYFQFPDHLSHWTRNELFH